MSIFKTFYRVLLARRKINGHGINYPWCNFLNAIENKDKQNLI